MTHDQGFGSLLPTGQVFGRIQYKNDWIIVRVFGGEGRAMARGKGRRRGGDKRRAGVG